MPAFRGFLVALSAAFVIVVKVNAMAAMAMTVRERDMSRISGERSTNRCHGLIILWFMRRGFTLTR